MQCSTYSKYAARTVSTQHVQYGTVGRYVPHMLPLLKKALHLLPVTHPGLSLRDLRMIMSVTKRRRK